MILLIVGLGNVGQCYRGTRHNVGFEVIDVAMQQLDVETRPATEYYEWAVADTDSGCAILARPTMLVNRSGEAVRRLLEDLELEPDRALVVADDFNLPLGAIRIRPHGSDGGHRGLASLIETLGTEEFPRMRLGIGRVAENMDAADFVLSRFDPDESETVRRMIVRAAEAAIFALNHRLDETMTRYNSSPAPPEEA